MKYIVQINNLAASRLGLFDLGVEAKHLAMLDLIHHLRGRNGIEMEMIDKRWYVWLSHSLVQENLPGWGLKSDRTIRRITQEAEDFGLLLKKKKGKKSMYALADLGEQYFSEETPVLFTGKTEAFEDNPAKFGRVTRPNLADNTGNIETSITIERKNKKKADKNTDTFDPAFVQLLPDRLQKDVGFMDAWKDWAEWRAKKKGRELTESIVSRMVKSFEKFTVVELREAATNSANNRWQGIFPRHFTAKKRDDFEAKSKEEWNW